MSKISEKEAPARGKKTTLTRQLRILLVGVAVPLSVLVVAVLGMLGSFNRAYAVTLHNATTAGELNFNFKEKLDHDMYSYAVHSKYMRELPLDEVTRAREIVSRLKDTTTQQENQWRIKSMLNLYGRLHECMLEIGNTPSYDERMEKLENDIYIITGLIETYMHGYIYDEVRALSTLHQRVSGHVTAAIAVTACVSLLMLLFMVLYSLRITRGITRPIHELCEKVKRLGGGDFAVTPVKTNNVEIETLDDGFNDMAGRIDSLLEHVREDQDALRRAEFELLQAQINPHFLYNTFDSIIWLAEMHKDAEVVQITTNLSTFFRNSLSKGKDIISLATEKQQVESYLGIQQVRYRDILQYEICIPDKLLGFEIPKLTLQPLVENAIYHGIKNKRGMGKITVSGVESGGEILLSVRDDGAGMTPEQLETLRAGVYEDRHTGLGLVNVHKRLRLYCGEQYGLSFDSVLGEGTTVTVHLPKQNQLSS